ncbi:hypothetical protein [Aquabacterium sp.]|uniref:hypothetical protein n=1 Tax=Aquabacterium sp. TaxID=1872578 RepID=UPI003D6C9E7B
MVEYHARFLCWWGLLLFGLGLGSRRSADNDLRDLECAILANLNRLADTEQKSLPVTKTLDHFIGHVGSAAFAHLLHQHTQRLIRMKALDDFRFQGDFIVAVDGTGYLSFSHHHCPQCLTQKHSSGVVSYLHPVLEAKLLTPTGLALSLATEFIENPPGRTPTDYQDQKQDCELKACDRLAAHLKAACPQLRLCLNFDSLYGCGRVFALCQQHHWHFVVTFKEGRTPELWQEFRALLKLTPQQKLTTTLPDQTRRVYRWVEQLPYVDSEKRAWTLGAILCEETAPSGSKTTFAWLTNLAVTRDSVVAIAEQVGRLRTKIENEGFNVQKNSGLNLEHVFSQNWDHAKAYYYLLQLGHLHLQLLHHNSLHRALAKQYGRPSVRALWGALKKIPQRLLEALRYFLLDPADFDPHAAAACHLALNSS